MAPKGQHTRSYQIFLTVGIILVAVALISLAVFRQEVLSAIGTFRQPVQTCDCSIPPDRASSQAHEHHGNTPAEHDQPFVPTIYSDLTILEELPPANVLWVNKTGPEEPEAWGISMFHALHCVKMWKESLDPATVMQSHVHSDAEYAEHANHCVKYLVQVRNQTPQSMYASLICSLTTMKSQVNLLCGGWHDSAGRRSNHGR